MPLDADSYTVLRFGKHKGEFVADVPLPYLKWMLREIRDLEPALRRVIQGSICRRTGQQHNEAGSDDEPGRAVIPRDHLQNVLRNWFRELTWRHHPDRGGDAGVMTALNDARDRLMIALGIDQ